MKILLSMAFISNSILLTTLNILENKSHAFERGDCTITVHNFNKTQQRYHIKQKGLSEKVQISLIRVYELHSLGALTFYVITFS